jgi:hypothetical protein
LGHQRIRVGSCLFATSVVNQSFKCENQNNPCRNPVACILVIE